MTTEWMRRRTPKSIVGLAAVAAAAGAFWVSSLAAQDDAKKPAVPEVLARVGDQAIGRDAVIEEASKSLKDVEAERLQCQQAADRNEHEALKLAVERVVHRRILALEAERRGMTEDALREELKAQTGEVTDADVDAFYEAEQGADPAAEGADRAADQAVPEAAAAAEGRRADFFAELETNYKVELQARAAARRGGRHRPGPGSGDRAGDDRRVLRLPVPLLQARAADAGSGGGEVRRQGAGGLPPVPAAVMHPNAQKAAEASLCAADQGKFWEMHDAVQRTSRSWPSTTSRPRRRAGARRRRRSTPASTPGSHAETVATDLKDGAAAGVSGTPAFFVNGRFLSGAVPFEDIAEVIDDEVRRAERD